MFDFIFTLFSEILFWWQVMLTSGGSLILHGYRQFWFWKKEKLKEYHSTCDLGTDCLLALSIGQIRPESRELSEGLHTSGHFL